MSEKFEINCYKNFKSPKVIGTFNIDEIFSQIKSSIHSNHITTLRSMDLTRDQWTEEKSHFPCFTFNFIYNEYKKDTNIDRPTGLLYIDIDTDELDIEPIRDKVFACWKSISTRGYGMLVKVKGMTYENFKFNYINICDELGLLNLIDVDAIKHSQYTILSFDKNMFINYSSVTFDCVEILSVPNPYLTTEEENIYTGGRDAYTKTRFDNTDEIFIPNDKSYVSNWDEGYKIIKCFIIPSKLTDGRYRTLLSFCTNLVYLNPYHSKERIFKFIKGTSYVISKEGMEDKRLHSIVNSVFRQKEEGKLKPIYFNKVRRIIFRKDLKWTKEDYIDVIASEMKNMYKIKSNNKLQDIINNWDFNNGLISHRNIVKFGGIAKTTLQKYYSDYKEQIEDMNKNYKLFSKK